ncbi:hypothetical protein [Massilia genomosp. 1]|uniref:DUF1983 domain-containing protein n=1 Tax=Massilia genomosp. 1 TaxID=2609280 RepID=A0ABX0MJT3_9BURK|nr:hypothetical protein [Massilia genomosp. 1]NHZ62606.1 hypothetical protein [Massilia genomosp. 1]
MTIAQVITPLPPAPNPAADTPATFNEKAAAFVAAQQVMVPQLNTWATQANALEANVNAKEIASNADAIATAADRVQTGLDRVQTGLDRIAAANSAATIGVTAAFSDANPMVKNAADNTKQGKFKADLISPGTIREYQMPNRSGPLALLDDTAMVLLASVVPVDNALTVDFLNVFSSTYDNYKIIIRTMEGSLAGGENINLRFAVVGVVDANSRYNSILVTPTNTSPAATNLGSSGYGFGYLQNASMSGVIEIFNANGTNTAKAWKGESQVNSSAGGNVFIQTLAGFYIGSSAVSGFRLFVSGSAAKFLSKGSIEVYGFKKAT